MTDEGHEEGGSRAGTPLVNDGGVTAGDLPDLSGATAVVTGANSGIGLETTRELAQAGAHVVMACRDRERAADARAEVAADDLAGSLAVGELDLASLD
jgi:NAD(P)-dependent dehydrogenase (short-subunit alcohol dehydrogenase family)